MLIINPKMSYTFCVNSFEIQAEYFQKNINDLFLPLLRKLTQIQKSKNNRLIVFLVAPPGAGKTTLSLLFEHMSQTAKGVTAIQSVGLDGFHFHQEYINNRTVAVNGKTVQMVDVKGCPETFDIEKIKTKMQALQEKDVKWPIYDRTLHDVVEDKILVTSEIVLIEGNWLLLDEPGWRELKSYCDYSIFIHADETMLEERLIQRKIKGGLSPGDARQFYRKSDCLNIKRVLGNRLHCDLYLKLLENGEYLGGLYENEL